MRIEGAFAVLPWLYVVGGDGVVGWEASNSVFAQLTIMTGWVHCQWGSVNSLAVVERMGTYRRVQRRNAASYLWLGRSGTCPSISRLPTLIRTG